MKLTAFVLFLFPFYLFAQEMAAPEITIISIPEIATTHPSPPHQWEIGLHGGLLATYGDVHLTPSWETGAHIRRALDYVFSIRLDSRIGQSKGDDLKNGAYVTDFQSMALQLLISINNLKWNGEKVRKFNPYMFAGAGLTRFQVAALPQTPSVIVDQNWSIMTQMETGLGIAYRVSNRLNIGIETNIFIPFGGKDDLIDGVEREVRDVLNYTNIRLNFNIGRNNDAIEPLYWVNPMDAVMRDINNLKNHKEFDPTDNDKDGVLDMVDEELNTPPNAPVDTKGRTLDSDGDGFPDYLDKEPYSIPGYSVDEFGRNNDPNLKTITEADIQKLMGDEALKMQTETIDKDFNSKIELINWILPIVHFDIDNYQIRHADYGNLANTAKVIAANPDLKFVVEGYTDKSATEFYNQVLSYNRAKAVIEFLVGAHSISREQLILRYGGGDEKLVPSTGDSFMNRRVELRVSKIGEVDMGHPKK